MKFRNVKLERPDILGLRTTPLKSDVGKSDIDRWRQGLGYLSMFAGVAAVLSTQAAEVSAKTAETKAPPRVPERVARLAEKIAASCSKPELLRRQSNYRLPSQKGQFNMFEILAGTDTCPGAVIPAGNYTAAVPFTDTGSTTGANTTVSFVQPNCIEGPQVFYEQISGPDHIYSFFLTARGANPEIRVTPGNTAFDTSTYILSSTGTACPAGTANDVTNCLVGNDTGLDGVVETISAAKMNTLPLNQQLFLFVDSFYSTPATRAAGPYTVRIQDVTISTGVTPPANDAPMDINADGTTDFVVLRNVGGGSSGQVRWHTKYTNGIAPLPTDWGIASDQFFAADYDGDGQDDYAVWRPGSPGVFYIVRSLTDTMYFEAFGQPGDDATVVGDYTGDGLADLAVYRSGATSADQSYWYYRPLGGGGFATVGWGQGGDAPAPGDYNGDGKNDFVIQRPDGVNGRFWKRMNTGEQSSEVFGLMNDSVVPGDYDNDGKTDLAVVRPDGGFLRWDFEPSGTAGSTVVTDLWGVAATDWIVQGDYDGDGRTDYAVWRPGSPSTFYIMTVGERAISSRDWGEANDVPALYFNTY
jgi:hypothetical protein